METSASFEARSAPSPYPAEYKRLMSNLLVPQGQPTGETRLSQWLSENREQIGRRYASEVARHYAVPA
jgi:hypothetical protein